MLTFGSLDYLVMRTVSTRGHLLMAIWKHSGLRHRSLEVRLVNEKGSTQESSWSGQIIKTVQTNRLMHGFIILPEIPGRRGRSPGSPDADTPSGGRRGRWPRPQGWRGCLTSAGRTGGDTYESTYERNSYIYLTWNCFWQLPGSLLIHGVHGQTLDPSVGDVSPRRVQLDQVPASLANDFERQVINLEFGSEKVNYPHAKENKHSFDFDFV